MKKKNYIRMSLESQKRNYDLSAKAKKPDGMCKYPKQQSHPYESNR